MPIYQVNWYNVTTYWRVGNTLKWRSIQKTLHVRHLTRRAHFSRDQDAVVALTKVPIWTRRKPDSSTHHHASPCTMYNGWRTCKVRMCCHQLTATVWTFNWRLPHEYVNNVRTQNIKLFIYGSSPVSKKQSCWWGIETNTRTWTNQPAQYYSYYTIRLRNTYWRSYMWTCSNF
jgi:hypothetical protein